MQRERPTFAMVALRRNADRFTLQMFAPLMFAFVDPQVPVRQHILLSISRRFLKRQRVPLLSLLSFIFHRCISPLQLIAPTYVVHHTMFSIENSTEETLKLREHERRVVNYVESILDTQGGMQVMAMEVLCPAPDCVPIETVILILFPKDTNEKSISSLVTSGKIDASSSVQFKILKPLAKVTQGDVELAIPFSLRFGTLASSTGREIRKALFAQLEQCIPPNEDIQSRQWMVQFLQDSLQQYADNNYQQPTDWNEEGLSPSSTAKEIEEAGIKEPVTTEGGKISGIGNITIRRPIDEDNEKVQCAVSLPNVAFICN